MECEFRVDFQEMKHNRENKVQFFKKLQYLVTHKFIPAWKMTFLSIYNSVKSFQQNSWKNWFRGTKFKFNFFTILFCSRPKTYHLLPLLEQILWRDFRQTHSFYRLDCFRATQKILHNNGTVQLIKRGATTLSTMTFSITTLSITKLNHYVTFYLMLCWVSLFWML